jgi:hypothetical protein
MCCFRDNGTSYYCVIVNNKSKRNTQFFKPLHITVIITNLRYLPQHSYACLQYRQGESSVLMIYLGLEFGKNKNCDV